MPQMLKHHLFVSVHFLCIKISLMQKKKKDTNHFGPTFNRKNE